MGLIKALSGSVGGSLADSWKEFFYCEAIDKEVLALKGQKQVSKRSSNTKGNDNIITSGSGVVVADGQCMIIVEQGKVIEVCSEPGEYVYDSELEPSIFTSNLSSGIKETFRTIQKRFGYGGDTGVDQRVYYFNLKEIMDNKFGTANPIPFRVVDSNIGLDIDISLRCHGTYSYKIIDPLLFYVNVCGNFKDVYKRSEIDSQLKAELLNSLQPAFGKLSQMSIRYSAITMHTNEIVKALDEQLDEKWHQLRGIQIASMAINSLSANSEDEELIKQAQKTAILKNPSMAAATLVEAQSEAMKNAASNQGGAMMGFMGMNMASQASNIDTQALFNMEQKETTKTNQWTCSCGASNTGKFCQECGQPKPQNDTWICSCGCVNTGKFCQECGKKRPSGVVCANCGWQSDDGNVKFCPECGTPIKGD